MKRFMVAGVAGFLFYSNVAFGLLWSKPSNELHFWGPVDVVTTAQYYCDTLKEQNHDKWRLPKESELLNQAPKDLAGIFWSADFAPFKVRGKDIAIAVEVTHKLHLYEEPHTKHGVICVQDQF